ncbi:TPA: phage tail protein [Staphylococcus pseudintermedius]|nr:phage tail protein [Staphylococcus pseudintermedius]HDT8457736.1 phage tail protein [Staphylococcus pseudintermedius]
MLTVNFNQTELEIHFGLGELTEIDKELGFDVRDVKLGEGLEMLVPKLQTGNPIAISKIVLATTRKQKGAPKNESDLEALLENIHNEYGTFKKFGEVVIEEMGKHVLTQDLVAKAE